MARYRLFPGIAAALILATLTSQAFAGFSIAIGTSYRSSGPAVKLHGYHRHHKPGCQVWRPSLPPALRHGPFRFRPWHHRPWHHRWHPPVLVKPPRLPKIIVSRPCPPPPSRTISIWVTNSNGSQTEVKLTRKGHGYIGPRGEYYDTFPSNEQLRMVYGF